MPEDPNQPPQYPSEPDPNQPPADQNPDPYGQQPYGQQPPAEPYYGQPGYGQQPYGYGPSGAFPAAPYGVHPMTGVPYSDKSKIIAGVLQLVIPLGIGRMYMGDVRTGVIQLIVTIITCGLGALWPFIDGIMLLVGDPKDEFGRPLRS